MTLTPQKIANNTTYYIGGLIGQKVLAFVYFILIARFLGAEDIGRYVLALSFTTILLIFIDSGLSTTLTRETAKNKESAHLYFSGIIVYKIIASIIIYVVAVILAKLFDYPELTRQLIYLAGFVMILDSFSLTIYAILRGYHNLVYESIALFIYQIIVITIGLGGLMLGGSVHILIVALIVASLFNLSFALFWLKKTMKFTLNLSFVSQAPHFKKIFLMAVPFALMGIFIKIHTLGNTIFLSLMSSELELGLYSVAHKFVFAFEFIPLALIASLYPALSTYSVNENRLFNRTFEKGSFYLMLIASPIAFGGYVVALPMVTALYGIDFAQSATSLQILLLGLIFLFLNYPLSSLLASSNRQKINMYLFGSAMFIGVFMNVLLIPHFGGAGAALAFLSSSMILFFAYLYTIKRILKFNWNIYLVTLGKILILSILMALIIMQLADIIIWWITILIGAAIYSALIWFFQFITKEEIKSFFYTIMPRK